MIMACDTIGLLTVLHDQLAHPIRGWRCGKLVHQFSAPCVAATVQELADLGLLALAAEVSCPRCDHLAWLIPYPFLPPTDAIVCERCEALITPDDAIIQYPSPYNWMLQWADASARQQCRDALAQRLMI